LLAFAPDRKPRLARGAPRPSSDNPYEGPLPAGLKRKPPLDGALGTVARRYNAALADWKEQPRMAKTIASLEALRRAATAYAKAFAALDEVALPELLGQALMIAESERKRGPREPLPFDIIERTDLPQGDVSKAFAPEITAGALWIDAQDFVSPSIARAEAVGRLAGAARKSLAAHGPDKGGAGGALARLKTKPPKDQLVFDCAMMIYACFEDDDVERISSTPYRPGADTKSRPPFEAFVAAMHAYATGSDEPESFERPLKAGIARFRRAWPKFRGRYDFDYWPTDDPRMAMKSFPSGKAWLRVAHEKERPRRGP
jgi:hypothetical protein